MEKYERLERETAEAAEKKYRDLRRYSVEYFPPERTPLRSDISSDAEVFFVPAGKLSLFMDLSIVFKK